MTAYVALLRGINLGKRQLKMDDLKRIARDMGLDSPRTYIASGNLLFASEREEKTLKPELENGLAAHMGAPVPVMIRTAGEMADVVAANPFASEPGNKVVAIFLDQPPPRSAGAEAKNKTKERIAIGRREIYVHYPDGQGRSKLLIPAGATGTARNMNSVAKLAEMAGELQ